jgi:hypothetical protein
MNQTFDLNRWWLLTGKHWSENRKKYLLSLGAIAGLLTVWYTLGMMLSSDTRVPMDMQIYTYYVGLFGVGCLYASLLFSELASGPRAMNFLTVPASHFEKLLVSLFFGILVFFVAYTAIFYIIDFSMVNIGNAIEKKKWDSNSHAARAVFSPERVLNVFFLPNTDRPNEDNPFYYLLLCYFALQSAFILGSVYFPKFSFIKTVIVGVLVILFFTFLIGQVLIDAVPRGAQYDSLTSWRLTTDGVDAYKLVKLPSWIGEVLIFLIKFALAPIFWVTTYFRLKEKEI